jgi:hypothetical protein
VRRCTHCHLDKEESLFYRAKHTKTGLQSWCKECTRVAVKKNSFKEWKLRSYYGLTEEQYRTMHDEQKGVCWICKQPESDPRKSLSVDHCHETLKIRGLLCGTCNRALGFFKDDPLLVARALEYLLRVEPTPYSMAGNRSGKSVKRTMEANPQGELDLFKPLSSGRWRV